MPLSELFECGLTFGGHNRQTAGKLPSIEPDQANSQTRLKV